MQARITVIKRAFHKDVIDEYFPETTDEAEETASDAAEATGDETTTDSTDTTDEDLICTAQNVADVDADAVYLTYNWYMNGTSLAKVTSRATPTCGFI